MSSSAKPSNPARLQPAFHERVWGAFHLEPWFPDTTSKTGEVWFQEPDSQVLVKFLFTSENLSVQVHPDDRLAQQSGHPRGKTEMWHILRAEPTAQIALGFKTPPTSMQVRQAAVDGSIMEMLRWIPVRAGDSFFIPAGAVHAIGAGITLCEVQQNSDLTYRLFDYGRGRELHIEESLRALDLTFKADPISPDSRVLADCPYFKVERTDIAGPCQLGQGDLIIILEGSGALNNLPFTQGEVWKTGTQESLSLEGKARIVMVTTRI